MKLRKLLEELEWDYVDDLVYQLFYDEFGYYPPNNNSDYDELVDHIYQSHPKDHQDVVEFFNDKVYDYNFEAPGKAESKDNIEKLRKKSTKLKKKEFKL